MRILFCNKYNYRFSGTEEYLFELMDLLQDRGHETALFSMADARGESTPYDRHFIPHIDFKEEAGWMKKTRLAAHAIYSKHARKKIREMIRDVRPDVAHVRNIYHHLSPSILWELKAQRIPVLYHLNDFKLLCPSYNLVAQGQACEACKGGAYWQALRSGCYPGIAPRMALVAESYVQYWLKTYRQCVDLFLAPSRFVREKFVEHGWDDSKFDVLPHFQNVHTTLGSRTAPGGPVLYVGRLSAEKGIADLLQAMRRLPRTRLILAGDGPQRGDLYRLATSLELGNVEFVGHVGRAERDRLIADSRFTVLPSRAYETFGKTILESYAQGRAVVATDLGSRRELVRQGETGLLYRCGDVDQLVSAIQSLIAHPELAERMGRAGWEFVRRYHSAEDHYKKLLGLYRNLIERKRLHYAPAEATTEPWPPEPLGVCPDPVGAKGKPRVRVAFIGGRGVRSKYSGIESYYEEVGKRLAAMGHDVTVYCRNYFTPKVGNHNGMKVVRLPAFRSKHMETLTHTLLSTVHALTQRYDIVHYHALGPALFSFLPRTIGTRTMVTVQGLDWQRKKWGRLASAVLRLGESASARLPDATMVVSRALQQRYRWVHGIEAAYVPNGGLLRQKRQPHKILEWGLEPEQYVLFLGRFSPEKGCHVLVEAFEQLETDVKLVMAGASSYSDQYSSELWTHACERILIRDWVAGETLDELLTNAMIFVLPSDLEGLSLALLDAMGAGVCVLTSDVPENREVVDGAGFTFKRGSAADLADRMRFLIANPAVREAAGNLARQRIEEQYQWSKIALEIEQIYLDTLGWKASNRAAKKPNIGEEMVADSSQRKLRVG